MTVAEELNKLIGQGKIRRDKAIDYYQMYLEDVEEKGEHDARDSFEQMMEDILAEKP